MQFSKIRYWQLTTCLSIVSLALSAPLKSRDPGLSDLMADCSDYDIPVTTQTEALIFGYPEFSDNFDVAGFIGDLITRNAGTPFNPFSGKKNVTGNYNISATFCSPKTTNGHEKTVLLASPGLGYDRRYWAPEMYQSSYSFVDYATSRGYSVFFYDRVGTGKSTKVSGYGEGQFNNQLAILESLTNSIRQGKYTGVIGKPSKIVHIGHSFGTVLTHALIAAYPTISDGVILTGVGYNATAFDFPGFFESARLNIASTVWPGKFPGLDSGYLAFADVIGNAASFFAGNYDKEVLWYSQDIIQPPAIIEFITGQPTMLPELGVLNFTGPVMVITGEFDIGNCAGNCNGGVLQHPAEELFKAASAFEAVAHPGSGHGINFNANATGAYGAIMDFVGKNGL